VGVAVDVTLACDLPGVQEHEQISQFGKGVAISLMNGFAAQAAIAVANAQLFEQTKEQAAALEDRPFLMGRSVR